MVKYIIAALIGLALGGVGGFAIGLFIYPYVFLADIVAMEQAPDVEAQQIVAQGSFIHANPSDPIHYGAGAVTVYDNTVHLGTDFEVGPGPAFHVYLVPLEEVTPSSDVADTMFVDLGNLRAFKGSQNYAVPAGVDLADYSHVVVWCEKFGVLISPARLAFR